MDENNVKVWGDRDKFKLILSVDDEDNNYKREIFAYEIPGVGVALGFQGQVNQNAYASSIFVHGVVIEETLNEEGEVIARNVVKEV